MQKLIQKFKPRLSFLVDQYSHLSFILEDNALSLNIDGVFKKLGFTTHSLNRGELSNIVKSLALWLRNDNLVLLHYRPQSGNESLINLLRAIKTSIPDISFENLIPVFIVSFSSKKQLEAFRLLASFNIRYVSFLTPNVPVEKNIEEILGDLHNFSEMVKRGFSEDRKKPEEDKDAVPGKIGKYKKLLTQGEELMRNSKYEEAINFFSKAIALKPDYQALVDRGDAYYQCNKFIPALHDYRKAKFLEQSVPEPYTKIGSCCLKMIRESMKAKDSKKAQKWFELGIVHFRNAESIIDDMVLKNKDAPEGLQKTPYSAIVSALTKEDIRGLGFEKMEDQISSLTARVVEKTHSVDYLDPRIEIDTRIDQAIILTRNKNYEKAEKVFRQIIHDDPAQVGPAFNNFAVELRKNKQVGRAFEIYVELLKHDVSDRDIIIENLKVAGRNHAHHLRQSFKQKEAINVYQAIIKNNPQDKEWVLCDLATTYMELQDKTLASSTLMQAIYINPRLMSSKKFESYKELFSLKDEMVKKLSRRKL